MLYILSFDWTHFQVPKMNNADVSPVSRFLGSHVDIS